MPSPVQHQPEADQVISVKVPPHLVERIDRKVESMRESAPGVTITRSDALRVLLMVGLDADGGRSKR